MKSKEIPSEIPVPEALRWYYYIHLCGDDGRTWATRYEQANGWDVARRLDQVITLCRRNRVAEAESLLAGCHLELQAAEAGAAPSVVYVMRRWYLSTKAYVRYHCRQYGEALDLLEQSTEAIRAAVTESPFLVGLANGCVEFTVHYARIARDQRRWDEMRRYFSIARAMYRDELPLCELSNGSEIFVRHIRQLVGSLTPSNETERASIAYILNPTVLADGIEILIRRVEGMTHVVVPFE